MTIHRITSPHLVSSARLAELAVLASQGVHAGPEDRTQDAYILWTDSGVEVNVSESDLQRMVSVAECCGPDLLYADSRENSEGVLSPHPRIDCQEGSLRDDFDFGPLMLFRASSFLAALKDAQRDLCDYRYAALYDLRLRLKNIFHLREYVYTESPKKRADGGESQFDYVNPSNRAVQIEMEQACTGHLKRIGAYLPSPVDEPLPAEVPEYGLNTETECSPDAVPGNGSAAAPVPAGDGLVEPGHVEASIIIPVLNREKTIGDAVRSALSQKTAFDFNVIVVDNHSTDGTPKILADLSASDERLKVIVPQRDDLGIGGCWNLAVNSPYCGKYAVQLDSDDIYSGTDTLSRIVELFRKENCGMVVGSYTIVDFDLNTLPPGLISHAEWTAGNGHNNALRINGFGAPRAFRTSLLKEYPFPNTSYGEDYAVALRISGLYKTGRIFENLYFCRRWGGNSDSSLNIWQINRNNLYKDSIRTIELKSRIRRNSPPETEV